MFFHQRKKIKRGPKKVTKGKIIPHNLIMHESIHQTNLIRNTVNSKHPSESGSKEEV